MCVYYQVFISLLFCLQPTQCSAQQIIYLVHILHSIANHRKLFFYSNLRLSTIEIKNTNCLPSHNLPIVTPLSKTHILLNHNQNTLLPAQYMSPSHLSPSTSLPSLSALQKQKSQKQSNFLHNQQQINSRIKSRHRDQNLYNPKAQQIIGLSSKTKIVDLPITNRSRVRFQQSNDSAGNYQELSESLEKGLKSDTKNHRKVLENQIQLQNIEKEYDLQKSRIQEWQNLEMSRKRNPYGKENVQITETVIDKYSTDLYNNQKSMLKKFQQQAQQFRKTHISSKRNIKPKNPFDAADKLKLRQYTQGSQPHKTGKQKDQLYHAKKLYLKQVDRQKLRAQQQAKRMKNMELMLREMKNEINSHSCKANQHFYSLRQQIAARAAQRHRQKMQFLDTLDRQEEVYRQKVPIVVYKNNSYNAHEYFTSAKRNLSYSDRSGYTNGVKDISSFVVPQKPKDYDEVTKIYQLNQKRLEQLCRRDSEQQYGVKSMGLRRMSRKSLNQNMSYLF